MSRPTKISKRTAPMTNPSEQASRPSRRPPHPRYAAMNDSEGYDDQRERTRAGRGVKSSERDRKASPTRTSRHRDEKRVRDLSSHSPRPEPASHSRHHHRHRSVSGDRGRSKDKQRQTSAEPTRRGNEQEDLIPRFREKQRPRKESREISRRRSRSRERHGAGTSSPTSASKRHRTRSPSLDAPHRKKSRRHRSHSRDRRKHESRSDSNHHRRHSPTHRRKSSPRPDDLRSRGSRAGSPGALDNEVRHREREPRKDRPRQNSPSRSPTRGSRQSSSKRSHSSRPRHPAPAPELNVDPERASQLRRMTRSPTPTRSWRHRQDPHEHPLPSKPPVDEEMSYRGGYRSEFGPTYSRRDPYPHDPRDYARSPRHGPGYHDAPGPSYGPSRGGRGGPYSPQSQYPPQHPHGRSGYGPPIGPASHYPSHAPRSPTYNAPSGPASHRGASRGGSRGAPFQSRGGRGGSASNNGSWRAGTRNESDHSAGPNDNEPGIDDEHMRPSQDLPMDDARPLPKDDGIPKGPSGAAPPTGPSAQSNSSKFSFAFKPSSKAPPTAPKPEISQKFNAIPKKPSLEMPQRDRDREPPPTAPTEPASARPRPEVKNAPDGPRMTPRMRKVKKMVKRPKPRPTLPADLAASESVFFRKPGNESVVGSGTYGKVFKGLNVYTKGLVALKRIRMEGERDGFPVTAIREIKLLQSLKHTNIVNLQEVMVERNDCFMVFEYLSHDLTGLLNHPSFKLDPAQKKHLAKQMFDGLDYLHNRGVLHRDIKAANILVSNEGILKIADFGLARFYAKRHQLDYTNRVITIWYRSPELLLGETQYTAAVDVWSAACVMVEIFTKHAIFPGDGTELSQLDKIYSVLGTPNRHEWPGLVDMAWFQLLKPTFKKKNVFADKYLDKITPEAFDLLAAMFRFDPAKRPTAGEVLQHAYFTKEDPLPKQAVELSTIDGEWHEFESKALRKENERREREARKAKETVAKDKDKKRGHDTHDSARDAKRVHVDAKAEQVEG